MTTNPRTGKKFPKNCYARREVVISKIWRHVKVTQPSYRRHQQLCELAYRIHRVDKELGYVFVWPFNYVR